MSWQAMQPTRRGVWIMSGGLWAFRPWSWYFHMLLNDE